MIAYIKSLFNKVNIKREESDTLAEFFLHATPKEKEQVFTRAAHKANEDQRELLNLQSAR